MTQRTTFDTTTRGETVTPGGETVTQGGPDEHASAATTPAVAPAAVLFPAAPKQRSSDELATAGKKKGHQERAQALARKHM